MTGKPYIVGIAGGSASGKTSFLRDLCKNFPAGSVSVLSQDNYYLPREKQQCDESGEINFDLPNSIHREDFANDLQKLISGQAVERTEYGFNNPQHKAGKVLIHPAPIIIMEGLFVFYYEEIRSLLDLKVYLDVREEVKLKRRILRDALERGYSESAVRIKWQNHVMPSYNQFLRPYRDTADIVIPNNTNYHKGLLVLNNHLKAMLLEYAAKQPAAVNS